MRAASSRGARYSHGLVIHARAEQAGDQCGRYGAPAALGCAVRRRLMRVLQFASAKMRTFASTLAASSFAMNSTM
jgi:hypothetical protein